MKRYRKQIIAASVALSCFGFNAWAQLTPERIAELDKELPGVVVAKEKAEAHEGLPLAAETFEDSIFWLDGWELTSDLDLKSDFDPVELHRLIQLKKEERKEHENRQIMIRLLHAAVKKDRSFVSLIDDQELREEANIDLALAAYDYTINGTQSALDLILAQFAVEPVGSDCDVLVVVKILDEWDLTIRAFRKHFVAYDSNGSAVAAITGFQNTRAFLYPGKFAQYKEIIGAPMNWRDPLPAIEQLNK